MPAKKWPPPGFPLVQGDHQLTATWMLHLPEQFARRIEDGSLVLWRPGLTVWLAAWGNNNESQSERLARAKRRSSPDRFAERESTSGGVTRFSYRLREEGDDESVESINSFAFADDGDLNLAVYFDDPADEAEAWRIVESVAVRRQA